MSLRRFLIPLALTGLVLGAGKAFAEGGTVYEIGANGLACPYCAYGLEKTMEREEGIELLGVDFERGVVTVRVEPGVELDEATLGRVFRNAGFEFRGEVRKMEPDEVS